MEEQVRIAPRLVGGHVALDLVNTVAPRLPADAASADTVDFLLTPGALLHWARRVELITSVEADGVAAAWTAAPESAVKALRAAVDVREATYAVLMAALGVPGAASDGAASDGATAELERLVLRWTAATARSVLRLGDGSGPPAVLSVGGPEALLIADRLAFAAVDLVRTADLTQLRVCPLPEGGCGWLFLDRSRNRSRRWCAMEDCGTQAKSRRLTNRRRSARATATTR